MVSFGLWMREQRGTCDATLYNYGLDLRDLLKDVGEDPAAFHAQMLRNFVLERTQRCAWAAAKRFIGDPLFPRLSHVPGVGIDVDIVRIDLEAYDAESIEKLITIIGPDHSYQT